MKKSNKQRVVGLDVHPDSFAGALLEGRDPASAKVVSSSSRVGARARRQKLRHYMAQEVLGEPELLRLTRLCGISLITLYGLSAAIGDVRRFRQSNKLVAYLGLNPSVSQSGNSRRRRRAQAAWARSHPRAPGASGQATLTSQ